MLQRVKVPNPPDSGKDIAKSKGTSEYEVAERLNVTGRETLRKILRDTKFAIRVTRDNCGLKNPLFFDIIPIGQHRKL